MRLATLLVVALAAAACQETPDHDHDHDHASGPWQGITRAVCAVTPTQGNTTSGMVMFEDTPSGLKVTATISGLTAGQKHGFHVHELGFCGSADATCTAGHYDPKGTKNHALPGGDKPHHAGDLGNLEADADGKAKYEAVLKGLTVAGDNAVLGRAIIVHAKPDDGGQPTGNAGARIGVGTIGIAK
jgi:Cu-Zn family superoxide dismutase